MKAKDTMVSEKVNRDTLVPVCAFHIVMELDPTMAARRSLHESYGRVDEGGERKGERGRERERGREGERGREREREREEGREREREREEGREREREREGEREKQESRSSQ